MRFLFFLVWIFYSFIFYFFYTFSLNKDIFFNDLVNQKNIRIMWLDEKIIFSWNNEIIIQSFFWNLLVEIIVFFIISVWLFVLFSHKDEKKIKNNSEKNPKKSQEIDNHNHEKSVVYKKNFKIILDKLSYYFWFILFYLSLYFITFKFEDFKFSYLIFFINIIIFLFFYFSNFSKISRDFLKVNSILFSLGYIFSYFYIIFSKQDIFIFMDFINSILIVFTFIFLIYYDKFIKKSSNFDNVIIIHFSLYLLSFLLFYFFKLDLSQNIFYYITILFSLFGVIWFNILPNFDIFKSDRKVFKYIWINFTYLWIITWIWYLFFEFSFIIFLTLFLQIFYNFFIHLKFSNYISYVFWNLISIFLPIYYILNFEILYYWDFKFIIFLLVFSYILVILTYFLNAKLYLDYYITHFFSYILNISWIILFLFFIDFELFHIWIILFLESIYFFWSYYRLTNKITI